MRARFQNPILVILGIALLAGYWWLSRSGEYAETSPPASGAAPPKVESKTAIDPSNGASSTDPNDPHSAMHTARGAGSIWGTALKNLYAGAKLNADGSTRLNVTALEKSFKGYRFPVDLDDHSAPSRLRAEYLAAAVLAALDLDAASQPDLIPVLESFYDQDVANSNLSAEQQAQLRATLCEKAREQLGDSLPGNLRGQLDEIFGSPKFLFETRSIAAQTIELELSGAKSVTDGNAVLGIGRDGSVTITGQSNTVEHKSAIVRPRLIPAETQQLR